MPFLFRLSDRLITGTFKSRHERRKEKIRQFRKNLREKMSQRRFIDGVKGVKINGKTFHKKND